MKAKKIGFVGLGLIGGSIAKAIRQYYPDYELLAFDKNKGRIGYGAGYYDRFLPMTNAFRCGIAFSAQEVECASFEETDLPMDLIITEREMIV